MININCKTCIYEDCVTIPVFNYENEKNPLYCTIHKKKGMIDIKSKKCIHEGCKTISCFNFENEVGSLYCNIHKKDGMVDIKHKTCIYNKCKVRPSYNFENEKVPLYCNKHKKDGMLDIVSNKCKAFWCYTQVNNKKYNGYCIPCCIQVHPEIKISRNYKTKENDVVTRIQESFPEFTWKHDKKVEDGCSKRRPDLLLDMGFHIIIVEIDENKHNDYECSCENKRLMEISQDLGHRLIVFIRFNPDLYTNEKGILVKSCWRLNKLGVMTISKKEEWNERIKVLKEQIQYWIDNPTEKTVEIVELFY
jgi:hypothetical protein